MNIRMMRGLALCLPLLACCLAACNRKDDSTRVGGSSFPAAPPQGSAILCGTVFDLATGLSAANVEVSFGADRKVRTDAEGRFQIDGLELGTKGEARVRSADGREASQPVLPLGHERREIVLNIPAR